MTISPITSRMLAWAFLGGVIFLAWFAFFRPILGELGAYRDELMILDRSERANVALGAGAPMMKAELRDLASSRRLDRSLFPTSNATLMAADLQARVSNLLAASNVTLLSSRLVPAETDHHLLRLSLDLTLATDTKDLQSALGRIAVSEPALMVERLNIVVPQAGYYSSGNDSAALLKVEMRVTGYGRIGS